MCCSSESVFPWVGAILINLGFNALIVWGLSQSWIFGVFLCGLYTVILYVLARWLQRSEHQQEEASPLVAESSEPAFRGAPTGAHNPRQEISLIVNLLLGLAVLSFGTTLVLLSINLAGVCTYDTSLADTYVWETNLTNIPYTIRGWARQNDDLRLPQRNTFIYMNATGTTLFAGTGNGMTDSIALWTVKDNMPPVQHDEILTPEKFVHVTETIACFTGHMTSRQGIACTDGKNTRMSDPIGPEPSFGFIRSLLPNNGLLWFKRSVVSSATGNLIYSLDPNDMAVNLYSFKKKVKGKVDMPSCTDPDYVRKASLVILFVAAIPFFIASVSFWYVEAIPSMAFNSYLGCNEVNVLIRNYSDPQWPSNYPNGLDVWFAVTSAMGIILATYFNLSKHTSNSQRPAIQWLLTILGIPYGMGIFQLLQWNYDSLQDWFLVNLMVFAPWLLFGLANENKFLVFLAGIGFLADAVRLAAFVGGKAGDQAGGPLSFLVFAISGLGVGFVGYKMAKIQPKVHNAAAALVEKIDAHFRPGTSNSENRNTPAAPDENNSISAREVLTRSELDLEFVENRQIKKGHV